MVTRDDLVGTWRLVGYGPSGPPPAARVAAARDGRLMYGADGHVAVAMLRTDGYWGYCGRFEVEGDTVVHHILIGMAPATPGSAQRRLASLAGGRLTLAVREPGANVELVWERTTP
jgi:Lipocalin-like domain